ncbi:hypothetical protein CBS101457_000948 [Exobasidium rhododendri]|nr:hypothetical protein CBS101457_000948 [Exobasidium rhododendri]
MSRRPSDRSSATRTRGTAPPNLLRDLNGSAAAMSSRSHMKRPRVKGEDDEDSESEKPVASGKKGSLAPPRSPSRGSSGDEEVEEAEDVKDVGPGSSSSVAQPSRAPRNNGEPPQTSSNGVVRHRGADGFTPGSIVRVKLQRFVTYDAVEFQCGSNLNMIIGPNGTGKSSLVCAIALGLGWKPAVLGRAKDIAAFVKSGYEDGIIELELKAKADSEENIIIERKIFTKDNSSEWRLNGTRATAKDITDKVDEFGIHIGNLCCFLPQDKVADFAKMLPPELLRETQKAAGAEGMTTWHEKLILLGGEQRELAGKLNTEREEVTNLEQRNDILGREVQRAEDREEVEREIELLELRVPFAQYAKARDVYSNVKNERNKRKAEITQRQKILSPLQSRLDTMKGKELELGASIKDIQKGIMKDTRRIKDNHEQLEVQEKESQETSDALSALRKQKDGRKGVIQALERQITELEETVKDEPPRPDNKHLDLRMRAIKEDLRRNKNDLLDKGNALDEVSSDISRMNKESDSIRRKLQDMDNVKAARLENLRRADPNAYEAVRWLRENGNLFREKVFEPIMLEISVEDARFASAVEGSINFATLKTFVCQTRDDYDLFTRELVDGKKYRLNVVEQEGGRPLDTYLQQKPTTEADLRHFGFDRYLIDCVDGPEPILQYLCESSHLHAIPFALNGGNVRTEEVEDSRKFRRYIIGNTISTITYSQYGNRLAQVLTRNLRVARTFVDTVDQTVKRRLEQDIQLIGEKKSESEDRVRDLAKQEDSLKGNMEALRKQQLELEQEKGALQQPRSRWERQMINLNSKREALVVEKNKPSPKEREAGLMRSWAAVNELSRTIVLKIMQLMRHQVESRISMDVLALEQLQHQQKIEALTRLKLSQEESLKDAMQAFTEIKDALAKVKREAERIHENLQKRLDDAKPEVSATFQALPSDEASALDRLEDLLAEEKAKLNAMIEVRPGVMREYNERKRVIKEMNVTIAALAKEKVKIDAKVKKYEDRWKPALDELIGNVSRRFSRAFESTGNAGEVQLIEHEDYAQWGIGIMVKFRDGEKLQLLTASRQSGGERSISTITYLLSLTEMSRSPFSLVDEINQGMDQKYERQVHNHMVNVTCRENAGQYFLITPKLLPNLSYHDRMKVLVINNGEWIPDDGFDFRRYAKKKRSTR